MFGFFPCSGRAGSPQLPLQSLPFLCARSPLVHHAMTGEDLLRPSLAPFP